MAVEACKRTKREFNVKNMVLMKIYRTKKEEVEGDIWAVQVITFGLGQGSVYVVE
jgi:hypothetical protein